MRLIVRSLLMLAALVAALAPVARAQSLNQMGVSRLNQDVQALWTHDGLTLARNAAMTELQTLVGVVHQVDSKTTATITGINSLTINCPIAPGVTKLDQTGASVALPLVGTWNISASVEVHVVGKVLFVPIDQTFSVTVALSNVSAQMSAAFNSSNPAAPTVQSISPPALTFNLQVSSSNFIVNALGWLSSNLVDGVGQAVVLVGGNYIAQKLGVIVANTPQVYNTGGPGLAPIARANLESAAAALGNQIEQYRRPYGPIVDMLFGPPNYMGTWADSLADPNFNPGTPIAPDYFNDSGEWTGHYLAALAFQYATTHDPAVTAIAKKVVAVERTLLTMRNDIGAGPPGCMNRTIIPISQIQFPGYPANWQPPSTTYVSGQDFAAMWNGQLTYFDDYTSRDEYMGLFYGLSIAHDLFDDPTVKASAQGSIEMALDYLMGNSWTWRRRDGSYGEEWVGDFDQQYAWILAAWHGNPTKYQAVHDSYHGYADIVWTSYWMSVIDPYDSYYKFQLGAGTMYVLLQHETDPAAWMRAYQAITILRHFIGHHLNAHFNNTYLAFDPSSKAALGAENTNLLSRWLLWPRRRQQRQLASDPTIQQMTFTVPLQAGGINPNGVGAPTTIQIAKYPLPPDKRIGCEFMWDVSPCCLNPEWHPNFNIEGETLDFVLPYWQSRYYGAIVPPQRTIGTATLSSSAAASFDAAVSPDSSPSTAPSSAVGGQTSTAPVSGSR